MSQQRRFSQNKQVKDLYDSSDATFCAAFGENLHAGYWLDEQDESSLMDAQNHLTDLFLEYLSVNGPACMLDVGCGVGIPALHMARVSAASIVGINISEVELAIATEKALASSLSDQLTFQYADMTQMPFEQDAFDGVYAIESLCHVPERIDAFREIYRVLKPGKRFVFSDPFVHNIPFQEDVAIEALWHCSSITTRDLIERLHATGFTELSLLDLTDNIKQSTSYWLRNCWELCEKKIIGRDEFNQFKQAVEALIASRKSGARYLFVSAQKPTQAQ